MNLQEIKARLAAITPGKWQATDYDHIEAETDDRFIYICQTSYDDQPDSLRHNVKADTVFIANAPADIDALITRVEELEAENGACWRALATAHGTNAATMVIQAERELEAMNEE